MHKFISLTLTLVLLTISQGCGETSTTPDKVVHQFLEAIRTGDIQTANALLTAKALKGISESNMSFAPPSSETASFRVGEVTMYGSDKALVESVWTDLDADNQRYSERIDWAIQLSDGLWRVSGMKATSGPDLPMVVINFEDPGQLIAPQGPAPPNTAATQAPNNTVPQQATRPDAQDPFRQ